MNVVAAGCGFDAEVMHRTAPASKKAFGIGAYLATAIGLALDMPRATVRIETDTGTPDALGCGGRPRNATLH